MAAVDHARRVRASEKENAGPAQLGAVPEPPIKKAPASRGVFECAIGRAESNDGDLLKVWAEYIQWARCLPESDQEGLLRRACNRLVSDKRLHQDIRFLRLWVSFAEKNTKPAEVLGNLEARGIGTQHALLFEALANSLEVKDRNFEAAASAYQRGIDAGAQPQERLQARRNEFNDRMRKRAARLAVNARPAERRAPLTAPEAPEQMPARAGALRQARGVRPTAEPRTARVHFQTSQVGPPADPGQKTSAETFIGPAPPQAHEVFLEKQFTKPRLTCRKQAGGREVPRGLKRALEAEEKAEDPEKFHDAEEETAPLLEPSEPKRRRFFGWFGGLFSLRRGGCDKQQEHVPQAAETMSSQEAANSAAAETQAAEAHQAWTQGLADMGERLLEEREMEAAEHESADVADEAADAVPKRSRWLPF